jgi:hypothetical protein
MTPKGVTTKVRSDPFRGHLEDFLLTQLNPFNKNGSCQTLQLSKGFERFSILTRLGIKLNKDVG